MSFFLKKPNKIVEICVKIDSDEISNYRRNWYGRQCYVKGA